MGSLTKRREAKALSIEMGAREIQVKAEIHKHFQDTVGVLPPNAPNYVAYEEFADRTKDLQDELEFLTQAPLLIQAKLLGIEILPEYYKDHKEDAKILPNYYSNDTLTSRGVTWLRRQIRDSKRETIKFWFTIAMPPASLLVAILSLLVALKKH
jgi:hypothetical protein